MNFKIWQRVHSAQGMMLRKLWIWNPVSSYLSNSNSLVTAARQHIYNVGKHITTDKVAAHM